MSRNRVILAVMVLMYGGAASFGGGVTDNFSDNDFTNSPAWVVDSGEFSADGSGVGNYLPQAGMLNFGTAAGTGIHLDFGPVADNTPVEVTFDLYQSNGAGGAYFMFEFGLADGTLGDGYMERATLSPGYFGPSGFCSYDAGGTLIAGAPGAALGNSWQTLTMSFDPGAGIMVKMNGAVVASWPNYKSLAKVDRLVLSHDGTVSWFVDNVRVQYTSIPVQLTQMVMDRFQDNDYTNNPAWVVDEGDFAADGSNVGNNGARPGMLNFGTAPYTSIHLDFGPIVDNTPVEVTFDLYQSNGAGGANYVFFFELSDQASGEGYLGRGALNSGYFGPSGFSSYDAGGTLIAGAPGAALGNSWQTIKLTFDAFDGLTVKMNGVTVAGWPNYKGLAKVDRLRLSHDGVVSWFVDNVGVSYWHPMTATPTINPTGGIYRQPQTVEISCTTPGATIRYTLDGSDPTETSDVYTGSFTVDHNLTVKAQAWSDELPSSNIQTADFAFALAQAQIPQCALNIDGSLSDWPVTAQWSPPYVPWDGGGLTSTTRAKFAWNDAADMLYVAIETNEASVQPGGHAVVGFSKDLVGVPNSGVGSTQLCFDPVAGSNDVTIRNEIAYYAGLYPTGWPDATFDGVLAKYSFNAATGYYTYEIAIPLWTDWRTGEPKVKQNLAVGDIVYLYSVVEKILDGGAIPSVGIHGTNLSWDGNPAFYNGAFDKAAALTLMGPAAVPGDANGDTKVDVSDLGILAANYGVTAGATWATGDFNADGKVDVSDLGILAANYGTGTGATLDFNTDAKALGLDVGNGEDAAKESPVSTLGCGAAGLPLILGLLLMSLLPVKLEE